MGRNLDSIERATLNWTRPIPAYSKTRARFNRAPAAFLDEPRIILGPTLFMPRLKKRLVFAAALVLLILFWAIAVGPEPPARISISAEELVRAVTIQRDSLIDLYLIEHVDPNGRDAHGRTPLLITMSQQDWKTAQRLLAAGARVDVADKNNFTPLMAAAMHGNVDMFKLILARSDNIHPEVPCTDGRDLLGLALDGGNPEIINTVIERLPQTSKWTTSARHALNAALVTQNKNQLLASTKPDKVTKTWKITDGQLVSATEDSAVLSYIQNQTLRNGRTYRARITDTFVKRNGRWLVKSEQQTLMK